MRTLLYLFVVDACVEFCFLKKEFLNLTINMQLLYFITAVSSQVHSAGHHQRAGYSASSLTSVIIAFVLFMYNLKFSLLIWAA